MVRCLKEYVGHLQPGVDAAILRRLLCSPLPANRPAEVDEAIFDHIVCLRTILGMHHHNKIPKWAAKISEDLVDLHLHFARCGLLKRPLLPTFIVLELSPLAILCHLESLYGKAQHMQKRKLWSSIGAGAPHFENVWKQVLTHLMIQVCMFPP